MPKKSISKFDLHSFFLELGSPVRMRILELLGEGLSFRNSELARSVGVSAQESLRHIGRLIEQQLVTQAGREYSLSQIGQIFIEGIMPQVSFLISNADFFRLHDFSVIPPILTKRFAELTECDLLEGVETIKEATEAVCEDSKKYVLDIAHMADGSFAKVLASLANEGGLIRAIETKLTDAEYKEGFSVPKIVGQERRAIEHLDLGMLMSEKEAYVRFPLFDNGALSTEFALHGKNINFLKFCYDLFQFYWEQAEPASDF